MDDRERLEDMRRRIAVRRASIAAQQATVVMFEDQGQRVLAEKARKSAATTAAVLREELQAADDLEVRLEPRLPS